MSPRDALGRRSSALRADLRSVRSMLASVPPVAQVPPPAVPWTESVGVELGRGRGTLTVRHTPGLSSSPGLPVVLLHGITLTADVNFYALAGLFGTDRPAIVFDLPNHPRGVRVETFTFEDVADDIVAVLDQLGVRAAVLCGYSLGGIAAMVTGDRHPDRSAGVIVQGSAMRYGVTTRDKLFLASISGIHRLGLDDATRDVPARIWRDTIRRHPEIGGHWTWLSAQLRTVGTPALATVWEAVRRRDHRQLKASAPTVVTVLTNDRVCPPWLQREAAASLHAHRLELAADHDVPVADPASYMAVTAAALDWIDDRLDRTDRSS